MTTLMKTLRILMPMPGRLLASKRH
jgi:hypothetical protein